MKRQVAAPAEEYLSIRVEYLTGNAEPSSCAVKDCVSFHAIGNVAHFLLRRDGKTVEYRVNNWVSIIQELG